MRPRKIIANAVGLAGCVAVVYGLHGLMLTGSCGGAGDPECPPEATPFFIAMAIGMPAAIIAGVTGGRHAAFALFPAIAIGALWAGFDLPPGAGTVAFVIGGIFAAVILVPSALIPLGLRRRRRAAKLIAEGGQAIGTVIEIRDTGVTVNNNPRVRLRLRIDPVDGSSTFEGEKTITVSRVNLPYQGKRYPVWFDRADRGTFVLGFDAGEEPAPEVRRLFELAKQADPARPTTGAAAPAEDPLDRLAKLNDLRLAGALTEAEFEEQKARILENTS